MKTKLLLAAAFVVAMPTAAFAQRAPAATIVVVDTNRILNECTACVAAAAALRAQQASAQQRAVQLGLAPAAQGQVAALEREAQELQTAFAALPQGRQPDAQLQARVQNFNQRRQTAASEFRALEQNFESTRANVTIQLTRALDPIYAAVMTARGANLMISTDARLANSPALDVTNDVLAQLNRTTPAVSVTPLPQQAAPQAPVAVPPQPPRPGGR